jgi:hypothetical protein
MELRNLDGMAKPKQDRDSAKRGDGGYPYHLLETALKVGEVIKSHGGRDVPKSVIAGELEMGESAFSQLCTSAKCYGIVEGLRDLSLSEGGHEYFFPTSAGSERRASLGFLATPPMFKAIIDKYDGNRLPTALLLGNLAHRHYGIPMSWSLRTIGFFLTAAGSLGIVDSGGFLRFGAALHQAARKDAANEPLTFSRAVDELAKSPQPEVPLERTVARSVSSNSNSWSYNEAGGTVHLETSDPLPKALWERLTKYVQMLEPTDGSQSRQGGDA